MPQLVYFFLFEVEFRMVLVYFVVDPLKFLLQLLYFPDRARIFFLGVFHGVKLGMDVFVFS